MARATQSTITGRGGPRWPVDPVTGLRPWGEPRAIQFPRRFERLTVGRDTSNDISILDGSVSRQRHATIERHDDRVVLVDQGSKNGCWCDGARFGMRELTPGLVVRVGEVQLIAWSMHTQVAHAGLPQFLGYGEAALPLLDRTLDAAIRRRPLALTGDGGARAVVLARYLHHALPGHDRPFVVLDERIPSAGAPLAALLDRARHGTIVARAEHLPRRRTELKRALEQALADDRTVRIVVAGDPDVCPLLTPIAVPSIAERASERTAMITEWIGRVGAPIGASPALIRKDDLTILEERAWSGYDELDDAIVRLLHLRRFGPAEAGRRLGVSTSAVSKWAARLGFST